MQKCYNNNPANIAIDGVSAGGHLAVIIAQRCLAKNIPFKLQILTALDDNWSIKPDCPYNSCLENASASCLLSEQVQFFMKHFLGEKMSHPSSSVNLSILSPEVELSLMKAESVKDLTSAMIDTARCGCHSR